MRAKVVWPDKIRTHLAPGYTLIPEGTDPVEVRGELWLTYVPDCEHDCVILFERSESGKLIRTRRA